MPDIDIDFADRTQILEKIEHRVAKLDTGKKHNTGVYVTEIPHNPVDKLSTIDYETAEDRGYFKLDFLNVSIYKDVRDETHLQELMTKEPLWELLEQKDFVDLVFHLSGHDSLLKQLKPTSVEQLAATLAIIRPAKRHLANETWQTIHKEVWKKPTNSEYYFKKAHAVAYAVSVVVHMNLICEQVSAQSAGS
jgi:DNA polymerase III alpha subunit